MTQECLVLGLDYRFVLRFSRLALAYAVSVVVKCDGNE